MRDSEKGGEKPIEAVERLRTRKAKLERVARIATKKEKQQEFLQRQKDFYQAVMENTFFGFTLIDRDYTIVLANSMESIFFRKPVSELIGKKCFREFEKRKAVCPHCPGTRAMATGRPAEVETEGVRDDGSHFSARIQTFPVIQQDGTVTGFIEIVHDITERKKAEEILRQSEIKYRTLIKHIPQKVFLKDTNSVYLSCNENYAGDLNIKPEGIIGKTDYNFFPEELAEKYRRDDKRIIETGKTEDIEEKYIEQGKERWVHTVKTPYKDEEGNIIGVLGIFYDITERKKAEEVIRKDRDFAKSLVETAQAIILVLDARGRIVEFNPYMEEISGYKIEEVAGRDWFSTLLPKRDRKRIRELFLKAVHGIQTRGNVNPIVTKEGVEREIEWYDKTLKDSAGNAIGLLCIGQDVTERKKAEQALRESEDKFRGIFEHANDCIIYLDSSGRILDINEKARQIFGGPKKQVLNRHFIDLDIFSPKDKPILMSSFEGVLSGREPVITITIKNKEGKNFVLECSASLRRTGDEATNIMVIARDITERNKADQKIYDYQQQLKALSSQLSLIEERAKRKIAAELHDNVGQRLATAKLELQSLTGSSPDTKMSDSINNICKEIIRIMDDVRSLTFELGNPLLDAIGLTAALERYITEEIQAKFKIKCELINEAGAQDLEETVRTILYRSTRELLINVVKHAQAHNIKVRIYQPAGLPPRLLTQVGAADNIHVCVEDDGVGFEVGKIATLPTRAGGFGLFSIKEQLEYIGGNLQVESEVGHGTKVTIGCPAKLKPAFA